MFSIFNDYCSIDRAQQCFWLQTRGEKEKVYKIQVHIGVGTWCIFLVKAHISLAVQLVLIIVWRWWDLLGQTKRAKWVHSCTFSCTETYAFCLNLHFSIRRCGFLRGRVSVGADRSLFSCDIWLLTEATAQPSVLRQANHVRVLLKKRKGPQTRQAAAGKLHQSVINEPTGRWDYMPNCTANQSIPKWPDSISLCAWPSTRDGHYSGPLTVINHS